MNVRRALAISIDRDEIVKAINAGDFYTTLYGYLSSATAGTGCMAFVHWFKNSEGSLAHIRP